MSADSDRQAAIDKRVNTLISMRYSVSVRFRRARAVMEGFLYKLGDTAVNSIDLGFIQEAWQGWSNNRALRNLGETLKADPTKTAADLAWPDDVTVPLPSFWTTDWPPHYFVSATDRTALAALGTASTHAASDFATPASVTAAVAALVNSAPSLLDTLGEIATQLASDESAAAALVTTVAGKFPIPTGSTAQYLRGNGTLASFPSLGSAASSATTDFDAAGAATTAQAYAIARAHHTGTQLAATISDFSTAALAAVTYSTLTGKPTFAAVATSGAYGDLSGRPTLGTAATHDAGDFATPANITSAVNAVVAAAPGALDTLKELADAMGDDANFATTVTNSLATKSPLASKTTATLDFGFASGQEGDIAVTTVSAAWVSATSRLVCLPSPVASADHSTDETLAEDIRFTAVNIVPGTSFDVTAVAPNGTWGRHDCTVLSL